MEERPPIWRVDGNVLNKRSRTADKGWPFSLGLSEVLATPHRKKIILLRISQRVSLRSCTQSIKLRLVRQREHIHVHCKDKSLNYFQENNSYFW